MPNWKKVLVSGSNAHLNQVTSSGGITTDGDLTVGGNSTVDGDLLVSQYIKHDGDANTLINFTDDRLRFDAGGINLFGIEKKGSAPHEVTVNNGGNNVDFVVKNNDGDKLIHTDASGNIVEFPAATKISGSSVSTGSFGFLEASNILFELDDNGDIMPV